MSKKVTVTIELNIKAAMNTDLVHWFMAAVQGWNNQMPEWTMTPTRLKTDGMAWPEMDETELRRFWEEWENKLPYDWNWRRN